MSAGRSDFSLVAGIVLPRAAPDNFPKSSADCSMLYSSGRTSQSLIVLSSLPEAKVLPSGLKAKEYT